MPTPEQPIATTLPTIIATLTARLASVTGIDTARVLVDTREESDDDDPVVAAEQYLRLRVGDETPLYDSVIGMGRNSPIHQVDMTVTLWTRFLADKPQEEQLWLTDASYGHLQMRHKLWDALVCFQPVDSSGNWYCVEPIKPRPARHPKRNRKNPGWGHSTVEFELKYVPSLDQTYQ